MDIKQVSFLARLDLSVKEQIKFRQELSLILNYIEKLKEVKIEEVPPTASGSGEINIMRADEPSPTGEKMTEELLTQAPERQNNFLKVKKII